MLINFNQIASKQIKNLNFLFKPLFILLLLISIKSNGQSIRIIGRVFDANEGKALEYAIVSALNSKDSLIGGGLTQNNGDFILENLPRTNLTIKLQSIGFETRIISIPTIPNQSLYDMGNIRLQPSQQQLKAVNIEAEKSQMTLGIDRRTYNVDKDLSAKGGSALDAMKNIPGINVGSDNSVQLRNQAPTIFVDGRPTLLSLDQIPADEIDRIEVITNPSAQYAADATGGILNVVMKKNLKPGYFGMISAGIGSNNRYSTNGNVTIREKKFSLQLSGNIGTSRNNNDGFTARENYNNGIVNSSFLLR
jgi:iron complex outermembrane receptor protein